MGHEVYFCEYTNRFQCCDEHCDTCYYNPNKKIEEKMGIKEKETVEKILSVKVQVQTNLGKKEIEFIECDKPIISRVSETKDEMKHGLMVGRELTDDYTAIILGKSVITISDIE